MSARGAERPAEPTPSTSAGRSTSPTAGFEVGPSLEELDVLLRVGDILRTLRFGTVLIVVQDGEVVQIEAAEKIRLR